MSEADFDRLLAGKAPFGAEDDPALRNFFRDLRSRYVVEPPPALREAHIAQMVKAARLPNDHRQPRQPSGAPAGRSGQNNRPRWRRNLASSSLFGSITVKILAGVVAAAAATGGLAATNALPKPVQAAVASAAGTVGVHLASPQAGSPASGNAQAQQLASTVSVLVQRATTAASAPGAFGAIAVTSATACTQKVSTIAGQLAAETGDATTVSSAQSLAARAAALAQESVGCAIPGAATGDSVAHPGSSAGSETAGALSALVQSAIGKAIVTTIQGCSAPLKSAIETLVRAALATDGTAQIQALVTDAKAVAAAAQTCAQGIGSAIQVNLPPAPGSFPTPSGAGNSGGSVAGILPASRSAPQPSATTPANSSEASASSAITAVSPSDPAAWLKLLSSLASSSGYGAGVTTTATGTASGSWSGMTGSWNTSGAWSPYTVGTGSSPGAHTDH